VRGFDLTEDLVGKKAAKAKRPHTHTATGEEFSTGSRGLTEMHPVVAKAVAHIVTAGFLDRFEWI
jgi:hypothetical protein